MCSQLVLLCRTIMCQLLTTSQRIKVTLSGLAAGVSAVTLNVARTSLAAAEAQATAVQRGTQWVTREAARSALTVARAAGDDLLTGSGEGVDVS